MSEYAERAIEELEPHYSKHVCAMTGESLKGKSAIAAELAFRDATIDSLCEELTISIGMIKELYDIMWVSRPKYLLGRLEKALAKSRGESCAK